MNRRKGYVIKLAYLSGLVKPMSLYNIGIRSRKNYKRVVLMILSPFFILYGFIIKVYARIRLFWGEHNSNYKYCFSIVAIAKNEGDYIEEWVAYYKVVGADCIFLYDNESSDKLKEKLQKYIDEGFVVYNYIEGLGKQLAAYNDALKHYGKLCKYMGFFDIDEFLMPSNPSDKVVDIIENVFGKDYNVGALGINWYMYGSSGHTRKTKGLVMERFVGRCKFDSIRNRSVKSIIRPLCVKSINHAHYAILHKGYYPTGLERELVCNSRNPIYKESILRINHYYTKSREEWDIRRSLTDCNTGGNKVYIPFETIDENDVKDETALYYIDKVKEVITQYKYLD